MQYNEILARRIVAEIARSSVDGGALQPVMLYEVARRLKIDELRRRLQCIGRLLSVGCALAVDRQNRAPEIHCAFKKKESDALKVANAIRTNRAGRGWAKRPVRQSRRR